MAFSRMNHDETGCKSASDAPTLCINNCGFFGNPATMNMCSKCYRDSTPKQDQSTIAHEPVDIQTSPSDSNATPHPDLRAPSSIGTGESDRKQGPSRCLSCRKRVGLTGFQCRCGSLFCATHRYSDKHDCPFDYRSAGRDAIAKANPVVKAEKLDKI